MPRLRIAELLARQTGRPKAKWGSKNPDGRWHPPLHPKRCANPDCRTLFMGVRWAKFCSRECKGRMDRTKQRYGRLKRLPADHGLPLFLRPAGERDPQRIWIVGVPLTAVLEDRLAKLSRYTIGDLHQALGALLPPHPASKEKERKFFTPDGQPLSMSRRELAVHDALLWGCASMLHMLEGKKPRMPRLTLAQKLRKSRPEHKAAAKPRATDTADETEEREHPLER